MTKLIVGLTSILVLSAQVKVTRESDRISVAIDGKPFTALMVGADVVKPYLYPLRAASGTVVTRGFPLEDSPGDSRDHPHHRGLTFGHADLNGYNFWANESFNPGAKGKIVLEKVDKVEGGRDRGEIDATWRWIGGKGEELLSDRRTMIFYANPTLRIIDFDILLTALVKAKFGDTHEGSFGVRVAAWLEEPAPKYVPKASDGEVRPTEPKRTGRITDSEGRETEAQVRGKRANWADYSGEYKGERLGIAIFDPSSNPRHPTYWHTRGYGMFAANIFAAHDLGNAAAAEGGMVLEPGQTLRFRYRVVIHPGDALTAGIAKLYADYTKESALAPARTADADFSRLVQQIGSAVDSTHAMETMRAVWENDRWFTFARFHDTARYLQSRLRDAGLQQIEMIEAPADGVTRAGYWTMPLAWDVRHARLEIVAPAADPEFRVLADYEKVPASLGMWSGSTPPDGVTAEIVDLPKESALDAMDVQGKLVLTSTNPANIKWKLARKHALGAINAFTENPTLKDDRQWINAWGDNGWAYIKSSTPLLSFSVTPHQAEYLRGLLRRGPVRVKATVDSRYYAGGYPMVTAVLPGADPAEEALTLGHTSEQGAHDNATGVAAMVESIATLRRLIESGKLPRPRRTIRILTMPEVYGSLYYTETHADRMRRTVAAMCVDTPAAPYSLAGTEYTLYMNPHVASSYTDALVLRVADAWLGNLKPRRPWHWAQFMTGTDTWLAEPTVGVPTVWPYSGTGVESHHNTADRPETVDPQSLRDLVAINASFLYYVANAGEAEARWLAGVALDRAYEQVLVARRKGREQIAYAVDRGSEAVRSVLRLAPQDVRAALASQVEPLTASLRRFGDDQAARAEPQEAHHDPELEAAAKMVVKRKGIGTIPLDELPPDRREGFPSGAWDSTAIRALYWCDGQRNLADVIRLTRLEAGPVRFDFVGYFRFLERQGYVEIH